MHTIGFPLITIAIFAIAVIGLLLLDLNSHKDGKPISLANATTWSLIYVGAALAFACYLWWSAGYEAFSLFLAGYTLEKVLSIDNLMVFSAIFAYFGIKEEYRHRILYYGIVGAIVFRMIFVFIGAGSLALFGPWVEGIFAFLVGYSAWALYKGLNADGDDEETDYSNQWYIRWTKKIFPVTPDMSQNRFFIAGMATPLFLCMVAVEISDVMFAFDSVPAVIAITQDPLIVYSAMIFAILGLRSLYFVLEALIKHLVHLDKAVCVVLVFIALKLGFHAVTGVHVDPLLSLGLVLGTLTLGVLASFIWPEKEEAVATA